MKVTVPTTDVNSQTATLIAWYVADGYPVRAGDRLAELETSKAVIEVVSPGDGILQQTVPEGGQVDLGDPVIGHLFASQAEREAFHRRRAEAAPASPTAAKAYRATNKAAQLAAEHGIDLGSLDQGRLITAKLVEQAIRQTQAVAYEQLPDPLAVGPGVARVLLIGAGTAASQVSAIYDDDPQYAPVAALDDDPKRWGQTVDGVPVVGPTERLTELFRRRAFDRAIITVGSVALRAKFREVCRQAGIPLANAIDRTAKLAGNVHIGSGNVICAFCHFGAGTRLGENNFISAYNSFDHHNTLGSNISTGPGCMTSGLVWIGDRVRLGTGVFVEPKVRLGDDVQVASGAVLVRDVPPNHVVKTKVGQYVVVPGTGARPSNQAA